MKTAVYQNVKAIRVILQVSFLILALVSVTIAIYAFDIDGIDWRAHFYPATVAFAQGKSPYDVPGVYNPPWTFIMLLPIAAFSMRIGRAILFTATLASIAYVTSKKRMSTMAVFAIMTSYATLQLLMAGNLEWLVLLGLVMPPWLGIFFVTVKPQVGAFVALWWIIDAIRSGDKTEILKRTIPITLVTLFSFLLYGFWPMRMLSGDARLFGTENISSFPFLVPLGVYLIYKSIKNRNIRFAIPASVCFSPHVVFHSYIIWFFAIETTAEIIAISIGMWLIVLVKLLHLG